MPQRTVGLLLADGFEEIEAVAPADILRRAGLNVVLLSIGDSLDVVGSHRIVLRADLRLSDWNMLPRALVFPGGMPGSERLGASTPARDLARAVFKAGGVLGAICAAPAFTLGPWGLADGKRVTCYPGFEKRLPPSVLYADEPAAVIDGGIVTARGPGAALAFGYALVELLIDPETADNLRDEMQYAIKKTPS